jgi:TPR repeat protein
MYRLGTGVPQDVARAVALLKEAAEGDDKEAAECAALALRAMGETMPPGAPEPTPSCILA